MTDSHSEKHFLDSSVAQPIIFGSTERYKEYYNREFKEQPLYVSEYIQMELKRSILAPHIAFYFMLNMRNIQTLSDAMALWSHRFSKREVASVLRLIGQMIDTYPLDPIDPKDKPKWMRRLGFLIKRIESDVRKRFKSVGGNAARCTRAKARFSNQDGQTLADQIEDFYERFDDVEECRSHCRIDDFVLKRNRAAVESLIERAEHLERPRSKDNKGFMEVAGNLKKIIENGETACSCQMCGKIGDAVIALEAPTGMRLEHTDRSFNIICDVLMKSHKRHPSEPEYMNLPTQESVSGESESS